MHRRAEGARVRASRGLFACRSCTPVPRPTPAENRTKLSTKGHRVHLLAGSNWFLIIVPITTTPNANRRSALSSCQSSLSRISWSGRTWLARPSLARPARRGRQRGGRGLRIQITCNPESGCVITYTCVYLQCNYRVCNYSPNYT